MVAAYLMKTKKVSARKALAIILRKRFNIRPNQGFLEQLANFQSQLTERIK